MNPGSGVLNGRRVLIVEDEAIVSMILEDLLTASGCVVIGTAGNTKAALTLIEQEPIDCAVLDVKLLDGCPYRKLDSSVAMMQTAEHGLSNDATKLLDRSADRRVLA